MSEVTVVRTINEGHLEEWVERTLAGQLSGGPYVRRTGESDWGFWHNVAQVTGTRPVFFGLFTEKVWSRLLEVTASRTGTYVTVTLYRPEYEQEVMALLPAIGEELKGQYGINFQMKLVVDYP